jgi:hypothetical protein
MTKARDLANIISGGFDATDIPNLDTAKITSGTMATARLGSGTASSSTFLRGDSTFASASSTGIDDNATSTAITIDSSENVGIGISPTPPSAYGGLHIHSQYPVMKLSATATGSGTGDGFVARIDSTPRVELWNFENSDMVFATNNTERMRIRAGGGLAIGGTGDANTLDDYEEGTWTPVVNTANGFSTGITQTNNAKYIKIGNLVTVQCYIQMGNSSGNLALEDIVYITGIPFTAANTEASSCCAYRYNSNNGIFAVFLNTTSTIMARCQHVNGSPLRNGGSIALNYTYQTT